MELKPGLRLRSQVCLTEIIVVRAPGEDTDLRCGGEPMIDVSAGAPTDMKPEAGFDTGSILGKRYTTPDGADTLELLVTKPGDGTLATGTAPLILKSAKPLPSSD